MRDFVEESFLYMHPDLELTDDEDLLAKGVIDSLGFVELVEEVQSRYGVAVQDVEITEDNFGSIDAIVAFVERSGSGAHRSARCRIARRHERARPITEPRRHARGKAAGLWSPAGRTPAVADAPSVPRGDGRSVDLEHEESQPAGRIRRLCELEQQPSCHRLVQGGVALALAPTGIVECEKRMPTSRSTSSGADVRRSVTSWSRSSARRFRFTWLRNWLLRVLR